MQEKRLIAGIQFIPKLADFRKTLLPWKAHSKQTNEQHASRKQSMQTLHRKKMSQRDVEHKAVTAKRSDPEKTNTLAP